MAALNKTKRNDIGGKLLISLLFCLFLEEGSKIHFKLSGNIPVSYDGLTRKDSSFEIILTIVFSTDVGNVIIANELLILNLL